VLSQFPEAITLYVFRADYSKVTFLNHLEDIVKQHHLRKVYLLFSGTKTHRPHYGYGYATDIMERGMEPHGITLLVGKFPGRRGSVSGYLCRGWGGLAPKKCL
jgi:hypothetical protein